MPFPQNTRIPLHNQIYSTPKQASPSPDPLSFPYNPDSSQTQNYKNPIQSEQQHMKRPSFVLQQIGNPEKRQSFLSQLYNERKAEIRKSLSESRLKHDLEKEIERRERKEKRTQNQKISSYIRQIVKHNSQKEFLNKVKNNEKIMSLLYPHLMTDQNLSNSLHHKYYSDYISYYKNTEKILIHKMKFIGNRKGVKKFVTPQALKKFVSLQHSSFNNSISKSNQKNFSKRSKLDISLKYL
jgi:hypothetical protein